MLGAAEHLPDDLASAQAMILAERASRREAEARALMLCLTSNAKSTGSPQANAWSVGAETEFLLEEWLCAERGKLSRSSSVAKAIDYVLKRWNGFTTFLHDGRICLTNNAAERALRGFAFGRKSWLFAGSDRGADRAAFMAALLNSAKLNDVDPQAWLADILARIAETPVSKVEELLPWNWEPAATHPAS